MPKDDRYQPAISPTESLESLPKLVFEPETSDQEAEFRRAELLQSVLVIAGVNHVKESQLVRKVVQKALGHAPENGM